MYCVETQERTYNSVDSSEQFKVVRENWGDYSPVTGAFHWIDPCGWIPIDPYDFEPERINHAV